ncbi:glycosyltransferase [Flavobacterium sp. J49]|uniref:glycosyltransferase n=1 Tax=Flavobacterium sp. J49 TaxID=2718534 RepID=UPI001594A1C3|nr:glycosyltransferase [Flavobacterium sp. J49]MBF6640097.1 glycosyltransferase [Flavobacterium sp. J49]NIC01342.1 glycosyltransferase family 4 protein [Flavobacterium sp. J49]
MKNNHKIAIVSASLGVGGAERFAGLLSMMLQDIGYEVHHIIILDKVDFDYKGKLVNLGKLFAQERSIFRAVKKGKYIAKYLAENEIDTVIDNRSRPMLLREIFTKWVYGDRKTYFIIHSAHLEMYLPKSRFWANYLYQKATKLICVSKGIEQMVKEKYGFSHTKTIYNPVVVTESVMEKPKHLPEKYLLFFGRLEENIKNFTLLLKAFSKSKVYENGVKLLIIGDGADQDFILAKINKLKLSDNVEVLPFQKNITPFIQHAHCTILTSYFEGFPMSMVESLAIGTPVISVDCETGPSEIIQNDFNGLLVENHNEEALAEAIKKLFEDNNLYQNCKNNAQKSVEHLSLTTVAKQWQELLNTK